MRFKVRQIVVALLGYLHLAHLDHFHILCRPIFLQITHRMPPESTRIDLNSRFINMIKIQTKFCTFSCYII